MPNLFERMTGVNLTSDDHRITIAGVIGFLREFHRSEVTAQQIYDEFDMTSDQITDLNFLYTKVSESTNPVESLNIVEDWLSLAEVSLRLEHIGGDMATKYQLESNFITRLNNLG